MAPPRQLRHLPGKTVGFLRHGWARKIDEQGLMRRSGASINDVRIDEPERRIFEPRPPAERGPDNPLR